MIVVCTGCSAKFRVADEKVGPRGVRLRCPKCRTVFAVERPVELAPLAAPAATPAPALPPEASDADPFASAPPSPPRFTPPPLPRRATTLDARAAFEVDLEPHLGAPPPADPFAAPPGPPAPAEPSVDPFAVPPPSAAADVDPFAGPEADAPEPPPPAAPTPLPSAEEGFDPFAAPGPDQFGPSEGLGEPPHPGPEPFGGLGAGSSLSLEEATTPPARRLARSREPAATAPMPVLGATEDPFASTAPLDQGLSELDEGVVSTAAPGPGGPARPLPSPRPAEPTGPPLQLDPFTAAAVAADPLAVADTPRGLPPQARPAAEPPPEPQAFKLHESVVSAMALAALLLLALAILVVWRGVLSPSDALRPSAILAALSPRPTTGALLASGVTSGLYDRERGAPLLFVRGSVTSTSTEPLEQVRVVVEVVRDGAVLVRGEAQVGAVPGPEALHAAADGAAVAQALAEVATPGGARLAPGASAPFLVAFADYPANLTGASLRVRPEAGH